MASCGGDRLGHGYEGILREDMYSVEVFDPMHPGEYVTLPKPCIKGADATIRFSDYYAMNFAQNMKEILEYQLQSGMLEIGKTSALVPHPTLFRVEALEKKHMHIDHCDGNIYDLRLTLIARIAIGSSDEESNGIDVVTQWFACKTKVIIGFDEYGLHQPSFTVYKKDSRPPSGGLDDYFLPYIGKLSLERIVVAMLQKYWPEALTVPGIMDGRTLAHKMGLEVCEAYLSEDRTIMGMYVHWEQEVEIYDPETRTIRKEAISALTILVDPRCAPGGDPRLLSANIIHECVHAFLHVDFIRLQSAYQSYIRPLGCPMVFYERAEGFVNAPVRRMEWQARTLTPRLEMPAPAVCAVIEEEMLHGSVKVLDSVASIERLIQLLAFRFHVSRAKAKQRMVELGYTEAKGVYEWVDGHYVPSYRSATPLQKANGTYSIGVKELATLLSQDEAARELLQEGACIYVERHLCLNDPKYVQHRSYGLRLTEYARNNIHECCLQFEVVRKRAPVRFYEPGTPFLEMLAVGQQYHFDSSSVQMVKEHRALLQRTKQQRAYIKTLPEGFGAVLCRLMHDRDIKLPEMAEACKVSVGTIKNYRADITEGLTARTVLAMSLYMKLEPPISQYLFEQSGQLFPRSDEGDFLELIRTMMYTSTVEACNEYLITAGMKPLTKNKRTKKTAQ